MKEIILIGAGGHCKACIDVIEEEKKFKILKIFDKDKKLKTLFNYKVILEKHLNNSIKINYALITVGQIKNSDIRYNLFKKLKKKGFRMPKIISPYAHISKHASVGEGTIVMHNAVINAGASIGKNCIINSSSLIEHDVTIGDHTHISTKAVINGGSKIGSKVFFGSSSVTKENIRIKDKSLISANKFIKKNI
jgi:sugar O-acyltransferase (sialic acid O-acetyltransferase NeuD family)|tara:strand:+ start:12130 stop:12708 length:579 start_codon:yes stop_codon:yes gene_type:complete